MANLTTIGLVVLLLLGLVGALVLLTFLINRRVGVIFLLGIAALVLVLGEVALVGVERIPVWLGAGAVIVCLFLLTVTGMIWNIVALVRNPSRSRPVPERRTDVPARGRPTPPTRAGQCPACGAALPPDAPEGLCPRCLLRPGLANPSPVPSPAGTTPYPGPFVAPAPAELAPHFPQLEILELVGQGGMGAVYKARQTKLDRLVALKILPPEWGSDPAFAERFTREARALARLNHPHIVAVHDFGETGGLFYLLMEYVGGGNLRQRLRDGPLPPEQALAVIPQLCDALEYAHEEGIVHRDVKPENILLDRKGRVKIADFGLAKLLGRPRAEFTLTGSQQVMGTLDYMAPEQRSRPLATDHRADIYALGVVFYEMLTGDLPLGRFAPPSRRAGVDARIDEVLFRALETDPDLRYQSAGALKTDIQSGGGTAAAVPAGADLLHGPGPRAAEEARKRVRDPAKGLLVTGILQCVCMAVIAVRPTFEVTDRLRFGDSGIGFIDMTTSDLIGDSLLFGWCVLGLLAGALLIQAALRMMWLRSYRLAWFGGVLAMLPVTPLFLLGLPVGSWALIVLREPEVEGAFADEARRAAAFRKRRLSVQPTGPVRRRVRSFFRSVRSLVLFSSPRQEARKVPEVAAESEREVFPQSAAAIAVAEGDGSGRVLLGQQPPRRNGFVWIVAVVAFGIPVILVVSCIGYGSMAWRTPVTTRAEPRTTAPVWVGGATGAMKRPDLTIRAGKNWRDGPTALSPDLVQQLGLNQAQAQDVLKALQLAYQEYLRLEAQHSKRFLDDVGHLHVQVSEFAKEKAALEDGTWSQLDKVLTPEQRGQARNRLIHCLNPLLGLSTDPQMVGELLPASAAWDVEIWRVGTWYYWRVQRPATGNTDLNLDNASGSGPELPLRWQRFWRDGKP